MDDDLKILIAAEIDEEESTARILKQLPSLAKAINSQSSIKVGVTFDDSAVQSQAQKIAKQAQQAVGKNGIRMNVDIGADKVNEMVNALRNLKVPESTIRDFVKNIESANVEVRNIQTSFDDVRGIVTATVSGINEEKELISQIQSVRLFTDEDGKISSEMVRNTVSVQKNYEQINKEAAKLEAQTRADNESRISYLNKQLSIIHDIEAGYTGKTSAKPVTDEAHLGELRSQYQAIEQEINNLINTNGKLTDVQKSQIEAGVADLKRLAKEYQNVEYVATSLRTKTVVEVNNDEVEKLRKFEENLQGCGQLTDSFKEKISALRTQLSSAFDSKSLTAYLNDFDRLEGEVDSFQARIKSVDSLYRELTTNSTKVANLQKQMAGMDTSSEQYVGKMRELEQLQAEEVRLGNLIASTYSDVIQYSSQAAQYETQRLNLQAQIATSEAEVADTANRISASMSTVGTTVDLVEAKFRALNNPTEELAGKVANLRQLMENVNNAATANEKVTAYRKLSEEIAACSKQISNLNQQEKLDLVDPLFETKLEKARADLEAVGRTWSALKGDPGLNTQFRELSENLNHVNNQMDLKRWTAQFSAFKSEVKAAGRNMLSFSDTLKNNLAKVTQWVSATTMLFRAFRILKSAVTTVIDLDTAMVDLRKTTDETEATYQRFYETANETAKALGVTTEEIISQTAEWSRLGYAIEDAAKMAENSAIFSAISPELSTEEATDGLISIMKAYDLEADEMLDGVISKINKIGNEMAVSNADIVEVMTRASSAMSAANNTFEETVALATSAVEITRDASGVGNALKTENCLYVQKCA